MRECAIDMMARAILVAEVMQRSGEDTVGHNQVDRNRVAASPAQCLAYRARDHLSLLLN